jgi:hypothetical protein
MLNVNNFPLKLFFFSITFLLFLAPKSFAETTIHRSDGIILRPGQTVAKYLDLEKCTELGNTKSICREKFIRKETKKSMELSKKRKDIVIISWFEEDDTTYLTKSK